MDIWTSNHVFIASVFAIWISSTLFCFFMGRHFGRKESIRVFDQVLVHIYKLVWTGKSDQLMSFMDDVCGKSEGGSLNNKIVRNDKQEKGYI